MGNFFDCIKTRKQPISDVESQHRSVIPRHLANLSLRLGRKLTWDAGKEEVYRRQRSQPHAQPAATSAV